MRAFDGQPELIAGIQEFGTRVETEHLWVGKLLYYGDGTRSDQNVAFIQR